MDEAAIKQIAIEIKKEIHPAPQISQKPLQMEFSKKLMAFASLMYAVTWAFAALSWIMRGEMPSELLQYGTWLYGATIALYCGKAACENVCKIRSKDII